MVAWKLCFPTLVAKVPSWGINKVLRLDPLVQGLAHSNALGHALMAVQTPQRFLGPYSRKATPEEPLFRDTF